MPKKSKTNPRNRPANMADVKRAKAEAMYDAMEHAMLLVLWVLRDKHNAPVDEIQQLANEINYAADSVYRGYTKWSDIKHALYEEDNITLNLKGDRT